ncbi:MAG: phosphoglucosamine mutase [Methanobrevibacter sp.]|jgi:phosphoglucosamine mutase|nr:phosphoglucosamine mutase [Candidatus Methanovirga basalitermitum]
MDNKKLFGTSGIRDKIGNVINGELALNVGRAIATYLGGEGNIVVGYDTRTSNKLLEHAITAGLIERGCNVIKLGMVPTPLSGYATYRLKADSGIMLTASHNPSQYNGIKIWNKSGMAYTQAQEREIEDIYFSKRFQELKWDNIGKIYENKIIQEDYINKLLSMVNIKPGLKVVIDPASGAASYLSPLIFKQAGCEVVTLNSQLDGFFPGRNPEPNEANLQDLKKAVIATKSDIGIAHDGDGDRMITVDNEGRVSGFDELLSIISKKYAKDGNTIITTVDAGMCVDDVVSSVGGKTVHTKVGDVSVAEAIMVENASFGGEPSGTWIHPEFCLCPDGILSGLKIAEIVSHEGNLSDLLDAVPNYLNIHEKIQVHREEKIAVMKNVEKDIENVFDDVKNINTIDGVRLEFDDDAWILIRPSGTEDYIRITLEGKTIERADEIKKTSINLIKTYLNNEE